MEPRVPGTMGHWDPGTLGPWDPRTLGPGLLGPQGLWDPGTLGPWDPGAPWVELYEHPFFQSRARPT